MSRLLVPWFLAAVVTLSAAGAARCEPPGTAKPIPESEKQARLALPAGVLARFGTRQVQVGGRNLLVAFSADGKRIALGGNDDTISVWDVATGTEVRQLEGLSQVYCFAFSPDGKYLATSNADRAIHLWELNTGKERREFIGHMGPITSLLFSPDGIILASGETGNTIRLWEVATGKELRQIPTRDSGTLALAFLPDGKTLASGHDDGSVRFSQTATGKEMRQLIDRQTAGGRGGGDQAGGGGGGMAGGGGGFPGGGAGMVGGGGMGVAQLGGRPGRSGGMGSGLRLAFAPDGNLFAMAYDPYRISLREADAGRELHQLALLDSQTYPLMALTFSPDGRNLATVSGDGKIRLWEVASGKERRQFKVRLEPRTIAETSRGRFSSRTDATPFPTTITYVNTSAVFSVAFAPHGRTLVSTHADGTAILWDIFASKKEKTEELHDLWTDLACEVAHTAYGGACQLIAVPDQSVPFLQERLKPATGGVGERIAQFIADLDSNQFDVREKAMKELARLPAEPALRKTLAGNPSLEVRRRIEQLLEQPRKPSLSPEQLRELRAVEVLEHIGTPAAQDVLKTLTKGAADARLTREAKAALTRLAKRPTAAP